MKLKKDAEGHVVLGAQGHPVYIHDDGAEVEFDAPTANAKIKQLNFEAMERRRETEKLQEQLVHFDGIDPKKAKEAIEAFAKIDSKKLIDAGKVDEVVAETKRAMNAQIEAITKDRDNLAAQLDKEKIGGAFTRSKFISDNLAIPVDMAQSFFRSNFKLEDGHTRAYDANGNLIYSKIKPGEPAEFEEAIEALVNQYPHKDTILKSQQKAGGGADNNGGSGGGKGNTMARTEFAKLPPTEQSSFMKEGGTLYD